MTVNKRQFHHIITTENIELCGNFTFVKNSVLQMQGSPLRADAFLSCAEGSKILCRFWDQVPVQLKNNASRCKTNRTACE